MPACTFARVRAKYHRHAYVTISTHRIFVGEFSKWAYRSLFISFSITELWVYPYFYRLIRSCVTSRCYLYVFKAKFHYAIWFEPPSNQLRTSSEPASVMEFGFYGSRFRGLPWKIIKRETEKFIFNSRTVVDELTLFLNVTELWAATISEIPNTLHVSLALLLWVSS